MFINIYCIVISYTTKRGDQDGYDNHEKVKSSRSIICWRALFNCIELCVGNVINVTTLKLRT